jgi:hypothetical protein
MLQKSFVGKVMFQVLGVGVYFALAVVFYSIYGCCLRLGLLFADELASEVRIFLRRGGGFAVRHA